MPLSGSVLIFSSRSLSGSPARGLAAGRDPDVCSGFRTCCPYLRGYRDQQIGLGCVQAPDVLPEQGPPELFGRDVSFRIVQVEQEGVPMVKGKLGDLGRLTVCFYPTWADGGIPEAVQQRQRCCPAAGSGLVGQNDDPAARASYACALIPCRGHSLPGGLSNFLPIHRELP